MLHSIIVFFKKIDRNFQNAQLSIQIINAMNYFFVITLVFTVIAIAVVVRTKLNNRHLVGELEHLNASLTETEKAKDCLKVQIAQITKAGGIGENTVLAIANEMTRVENNLYRMEEVPGRKQISRALNRMKADLQAEGYTLVPLLGVPYKEGMQMSVTFVLDESLPPGCSIITSVQKPQVNYNGVMIQAANVTVGQNN